LLSFFCSATVHASVLAWVALLPVMHERPRASLYEQEIRPNQHRIIWYSLADRLPEISPATPQADVQPLRARAKSTQRLVAGAKETNHTPQLIWTPAPSLAIPQTIPSPNLVALAPPTRLVRSFEPVPQARPAAAPPPGVLPTAPTIPDAPAAAASPLPLTIAKAVRAFQAPPDRQAPVPQSATRLVEPPPDTPPDRAREVGLAIVSLFPMRNAEIPTPKASQQAEFSAGPVVRSEGGNTTREPTQLVIPGLLAHSEATDPSRSLVASLEAPTSRRNLIAAARGVNVGTAPPAEHPRAARVVDPPDPHFQGRAVYALAIQMPNITSYSGSWLVWFAEHQPEAGTPPSDLRPPSPLRKVDPKYLPQAIEDRAEGKVRLLAVIRKDGKVDVLEVVRSADSRLDQSAAEALAKWEFEPATRDGQPIDVDALFEIPFRLAPR
jgi:TonB family protein